MQKEKPAQVPNAVSMGMQFAGEIFLDVLMAQQKISAHTISLSPCRSQVMGELKRSPE